MDGKLNLTKLGEYVEENDSFNPVIYKAAKLEKWFGETERDYNWYGGEEGLNREGFLIK